MKMGNKVVYNACFGGFRLSQKAYQILKEKKGFEDHCISYRFLRHDPDLVAVVEELGPAANSEYSNLQIEEIEDDRYWIEEYDGIEQVHTPSDMKWVLIEE